MRRVLSAVGPGGPGRAWVGSGGPGASTPHDQPRVVDLGQAPRMTTPGLWIWVRYPPRPPLGLWIWDKHHCSYCLLGLQQQQQWPQPTLLTRPAAAAVATTHIGWPQPRGGHGGACPRPASQRWPWGCSPQVHCPGPRTTTQAILRSLLPLLLLLPPLQLTAITTTYSLLATTTSY